MDGDSDKSLVLETAGDVRRNGYTVHAFCEDCGYNAEVILLEKHDHITVQAMRKGLVCGECKSHNTDMKIFQKIPPAGLH